MKLDSFAAGALSALVLAALLGMRPARPEAGAALAPSASVAGSTAILVTNHEEGAPTRTVRWKAAEAPAHQTVQLEAGETVIFSLGTVQWVRPEPGLSWRPY